MSLFSGGLDPVFEALARAGLFVLFFGAALHKARDFSAFSLTVRDYQILPDRLSKIAARCLAAGEAGVALCLLFAPLDPLGSLGALALFALYSGVIGINLARGRRHIDCGCAGFGQRGQAISGGLLLRNAGLAGVALLLLFPVNPRPLGWIDLVSVAAGLGIGTLLWLAGHELGRARNSAAPMESAR